MSEMTRRHFLRAAGAAALGGAGLCRVLEEVALQEAVAAQTARRATGPKRAVGYGPLIADPRRVLDLPAGFSYRVLSRAGERMSDGLRVPGRPGGMAAFPGPRGITILLRNHELGASTPALGAFGGRNERLGNINPALFYDFGAGRTPALGAATTLVYDTRRGQVQREYLSLAGTLRNGGGGPTPWRTWLSCEAVARRGGGGFEKDHGYNFEVPAAASLTAAALTLARPVPLKAMGRFNHGAVAVDPRSGIVYQTEDRADGLLYRFIPNAPRQMSKGGRLQALKIKGGQGIETGKRGVDTRNQGDGPRIVPRQNLDAAWVDLDQVAAPGDDLRRRGFAAGAARFGRGQGMGAGRGAIYFACAAGGPRQKGQIWRYAPSRHEGRPREDRVPGQLQLFVEPNRGELAGTLGDLAVAPWGDVLLCESGPRARHLSGVTPWGKFHRVARNALNDSGFAGVAVSPDASTVFVNIPNPGLTLAITGPWRERVP